AWRSYNHLLSRLLRQAACHLRGEMLPDEALDDILQRLVQSEVLLHAQHKMRDVGQRWILPGCHEDLKLLQGPNRTREIVSVGRDGRVGLLIGEYHHRHHLAIRHDLDTPILRTTRRSSRSER